MAVPRVLCVASTVALALVACAGAAPANFSSNFGDAMVLQREPSQASVYGFADAGATITLTVTSDRDTLLSMPAPVSPDGHWKVRAACFDVVGPSHRWCWQHSPMPCMLMNAAVNAGHVASETSGRELQACGGVHIRTMHRQVPNNP